MVGTGPEGRVQVQTMRGRSIWSAGGPHRTLPRGLTADLRETAFEVGGALDAEMLADRVGHLLAEEADAVDGTRSGTLSAGCSTRQLARTPPPSRPPRCCTDC